jgi:hypothetical protein
MDGGPLVGQDGSEALIADAIGELLLFGETKDLGGFQISWFLRLLTRHMLLLLATASPLSVLREVGQS